jgi:uncharacterized metal-binding protein
MPSGKTHDLITIISTPIILTILLVIGMSVISIIIMIASYLFASFMFNGDLDVISKPYNRWGILKFIWKPYQSIFKHRSVFTHGLIIGTIIRLFYLFFIPILIMYFNDYDFSMLYNIHCLYVLIGLEFGSALHTISDYIL